MKKAKSLIFTLLVSGAVFGALHFIPVEIGIKEKKESNFPEISEEEELLGIGENLEEEKVDVPPPIISPEPITPVEEPKPTPEPETPAPIAETKKETPKTEKIVETKKQQEETKPQTPKKTEEKKLTDKKTTEETPKQPQKESKIGVDRKLISGIPGTMKYKGKFPSHNVTEKGSITITYTVDENGNVISAYRTAGLRERNTINNAVTLVRKYVKAEKGKTTSTGTYTIDFK